MITITNRDRLWSRLNWLSDIADDAGYSIDFHPGYAEPGYDDPPSGIVALGNWNNRSRWDEETRTFVVLDNTMPRIARILERLGVEIEWHDEWIDCCDCNKLVRTQPDCYSWQKSYHMDGDGGDLLCVECLKRDAAEYLASLEGSHTQCNTIDAINPEDYGYIRVNEDSFENGFHPGQADSPEKIAAALRRGGIERFLFGLDSVGQFDARFSVYIHLDESLAGARIALHLGDVRMEVSPAEAMEKALRQASEQSAALRASGQDGIIYSTCHGDGTATTRIVSPQEFLEGLR